MGRDLVIPIRVSDAEKRAIQSAAEDAGMSVSELMRRAVKAVNPKALRGPEPLLPQIDVFKPRRRQVRPPEELPEFRAPFLHGAEGHGFERIVRYAARQMRTDQHTMALATTFLAEGLANAIISGQIVRWPGVFVAGPYLSRSKRDGHERVYARLQPCPPLNRETELKCPTSLARNHELDAHYRRSRREGVQGVHEVMETMRQAIVNQDLQAQRIFEDYWRDESIAHVV